MTSFCYLFIEWPSYWHKALFLCKIKRGAKVCS